MTLYVYTCVSVCLCLCMYVHISCMYIHLRICPHEQVVSTNPHPMRVAAGNKMTQCPPREWRFPHVRLSMCFSFISNLPARASLAVL